MSRTSSQTKLQLIREMLAIFGSVHRSARHSKIPVSGDMSMIIMIPRVQKGRRNSAPQAMRKTAQNIKDTGMVPG
jgi:hypothetical protein